MEQGNLALGENQNTQMRLFFSEAVLLLTKDSFKGGKCRTWRDTKLSIVDNRDHGAWNS